MARGWVQDGEKEGMGIGLAEPGEMGWVWITNDLEEFGLHYALSGGRSYLNKKPFTTQNIIWNSKLKKKKDKIAADLT